MTSLDRGSKIAPAPSICERRRTCACARHLRLVVKTSQCTGGPLFQGDQDADPTVNADCDSNVAANASRRFVRAAEFQAFSQDGSVNRSGGGGGGDDDD